MQTSTITTAPTDTSRYARCIEASKRIRWEIDRDVIRGRSFDVSKKFLPDGLSMIDKLGFLSADEKRLQVFVTIARGADVVATVEQMLLHVDMKAGKTCAAAPGVLARLMPIAEAHRALARPAEAGRAIGRKG